MAEGGVEVFGLVLRPEHKIPSRYFLKFFLFYIQDIFGKPCVSAGENSSSFFCFHTNSSSSGEETLSSSGEVIISQCQVSSGITLFIWTLFKVFFFYVGQHFAISGIFFKSFFFFFFTECLPVLDPRDTNKSQKFHPIT